MGNGHFSLVDFALPTRTPRVVVRARVDWLGKLASPPLHCMLQGFAGKFLPPNPKLKPIPATDLSTLSLVAHPP